jgi:hypothetical protein
MKVVKSGTDAALSDIAAFYGMLASETRLLTVWVVQECTLPATLNDLAAKVLTLAESEFPGEELPTEGNAVSQQLCHVHLPKLDDHGVIRFDRERQTIEEGENYDWIRDVPRPAQSR